MVESKIAMDRGVTLIELMIVLVIAVILVGGIYSLFITQHKSYSIQDQVVGAQQDARVALDIMARDIRMAGSLAGGEGFTVNTYSFAITPNNGGGSSPASNPDIITVVDAAEEFFSGVNPVTVCTVAVSTVTLGVRDPVTNACNSVAIGSFFDDNKKKYVAFEGVNHVYEIKAGGVSGSQLTLNDPPPAYIENVGSQVFLVKAITYEITSDGVLRRDENTGNGAQPLAGDGINTIVEDLQFAYQVRGVTYWTFDGVVDAAHGETSDTALPAGSTNIDIRMVRITIIVKTAIPDPKETGFFKPACEDHGQANTDPGNRRRVYQTVVKVRNLKS